ncbi:MAG TPA: hypothetical protein VGA68_10560 [Woeseiaceae bacterium]|jgi:hypothetical protein
MGRATARAPIELPAALNAPLFRMQVDELETSACRVVLDLGAASTPMLDLLGRSRCRVEIADLAGFGGIERLSIEAPAGALAAIAASLLPSHNPDRDIDLVFCWDLLNYLKPPAISALMSTIAARARPGTRVHALIVYSERSMPDRPGRYVPDKDLKLVNRAVPASEIAAPRYSPELLGRTMGLYAIEHARLLANGMQEFLFRLKR